MNPNASSPINPFKEFKRPRFVITKSKAEPLNPFRFNGNDSKEKDSSFSFKLSKDYKSHSGLNPFLTCYKEKAPFLKGIQNTNTFIKGLNNNDNKNNIANSFQNKQPMVYKPNINIYICDRDFFNNCHSEKDSNQSYIKTEIKKKDCSMGNNSLNKERDNQVLNITQNLNMDAPPIVPLIDPIREVTNLIEKMNLNEGKEKDKKNNEKIFTNKGDFQLGKYYIE